MKAHLDALVVLVLLGPLSQVVDDGMIGVNLQMLLSRHVTCGMTKLFLHGKNIFPFNSTEQ